MALDFWTSTHCRYWIFKKQDLVYSRKRDKSHFDEVEFKILLNSYVELINNLSQAIKLRRRVAATAIVHFRRFYWKHCLLDFDPNLVAPTCLFVASKVEENLVQIHVFLEAMKIFDPSFEYCSNDIQQCEFHLLEGLNFDLVVYHPYRPLLSFVVDSKQQDLLETAWMLVNDSYYTDLALTSYPYNIALGCLYISSYVQQKDINGWFNDISVRMNEVMNKCYGMF